MEKGKQPTKQHKQNSFIQGVQKLITIQPHYNGSVPYKTRKY